MDISIDRTSSIPIYRQIVERIEQMILSGGLPHGFQLPPERRLAAALGVNRSTVLAAYRELKGRGLVDSHVGRGTIVRDARPEVEAPARRMSILWQQVLRSGPLSGSDLMIRDLLALAERPDVISLAAGLPASDLMPMAALRELLDQLLSEVGPALLQHCPAEGLTVFRETLCQWLASRGITCRCGELLVLSGSQQGLDLLARVLLEPGDEVVVEEPSYIGALPVLRAAGARMISVPTDEHGLQTDLLATVLERRRPKLIYTLPTFQNPSGAVLSVERRRHLLDLAARHQVPIVEDDPYSEVRYRGASVPALRAMDTDGVVIYLSTFSKILFPGLRIGYIVAPKPVTRQLVLAKQAVDLHTNGLGQYLVERFISQGLLEPHLASLRTAYGSRCDAMARALGSAGELMQWRRPDGGFYFWCRLSPEVESSQLLTRCSDAGIAFLPGGSCFAAEPTEPYIRLSFSYPNEAHITEGVTRLLTALRRSTHHRAVRAPDPGGTPPLV